MHVVHVLKAATLDAGGYQGTFPDVPGPIVHATDLPLLQLRAREALLVELQRLEAVGSDWPEAPTLAKLHDDPGSLVGLHFIVDVTVDEAPVRVNVTLPTHLLRRLDETVERLDMTRSGYIAAAVRERLERTADFNSDEPFLRRLAEELARVGGQLNDSFGPKSNLEKLWSELDQRAIEGLRGLFSRRQDRREGDGD